MPLKEDLMQFVNDASTSPTTVKAAAAASSASGISAVFGVLEKGIGIAAAVMGVVVTTALWKKLQLEKEEALLRIKILKKEHGYDESE